MALAYAGITRQMRHDISELKETVRELRELCDRYGFAYCREWALLLSARAHRPDQARAALDAAIATGHAHDDLWWLPEVMRMRAAYDDDEPRGHAPALGRPAGLGSRQHRPAPALRAGPRQARRSP